MSHSQIKTSKKQRVQKKRKQRVQKERIKRERERERMSLHCEFCSIVLVSDIVFGLLELVLGT